LGLPGLSYKLNILSPVAPKAHSWYCSYSTALQWLGEGIGLALTWEFTPVREDVFIQLCQAMPDT
jgi:hypothetical protein